MTEKRYSDGTLAKWYYSQTNVISDGDNEYYLRSKESVKDLNYNELLGTNDLLDELNRLSDENEQLKSENKKLKELVIEVDNELKIRDIVCGAGKFRLEEWGKHRYHQFYKGDEELEDESVVIMLMELEKGNKELIEENEQLRKTVEKR